MSLEADEERLDALLDQCEELILEGMPVSVEHVCADFPELIGLVREHLEAREFMAQWREVFECDSPDPAGGLVVGAVIGSYRVDQRVGSGAMGVVYKALHTQMVKVVALKLLPAERRFSAEAVRRFQREMVANGKLDHVNIVRCTDSGVFEGRYYLVMDFVDGGNLSTLIEESGPLSVSRACEFARQAALGLQHIHARRILHRDIKPSNLMVTRDGVVKIADLGLALFHAEDDLAGSEVTDVGIAVGTRRYMAPEQCTNSRDVDARADLYSLGATLFKMLTGRAPFELVGDAPAPRIASLRPDIPPNLARLIERMLARSRDDRPASAADVAEALAPFASGTIPDARVGRPRSHRRSRLVAIALLILALSAPAIFLGPKLLRSPSQPTGPNGPPPPDGGRREAPGVGVGDDVDRAVAARVVAMGGYSDVQPEGTDDEIGIGSRKAIPKVPFSIRGIYVGSKPGVDDAFLQEVSRLRELNYLELNETRVTDVGVKSLGRLGTLRTLDLKNTGVTDEGLAIVAELPSLVTLKLSDTAVSDRSLPALRNLKGLRKLYLKNARITNQGASILSQCRSLEWLDLRETQIDDRGLAHLQSLENLKKLWITETGLTPGSISGFKESRPACEWNPQGSP